MASVSMFKALVLAVVMPQILETNSRTDSSTLPLLSLIFINLTRNQAIENLKTFLQLSQNSTADDDGPLLLKGSYERCAIIYRLILRKIKVAFELSKKGKYKEIIQLGEGQDLLTDVRMGFLIGIIIQRLRLVKT
ncbi:hypothetical protein M9H77_30205 [Catharanthus roseus]|uniref:Uncharacterized protein n=1 Tax=Catharanthus roseus TaxID=4058 RepID=A0ACC0A0T8_CATRO|nr:hypothetical protein M9H77_30205 [Catharanthus roseus]